MKYVKDNCGRWAFIVVSTDDVGPAQLPNAPIVDEQDVMTLPVKLSKSWHVALLHGTPAWIDHESFAFRAVNGAEGDSVTEDKLVSVEAGGKDPQRLQDNEEFPLNMPDIACLAWPPRKS